MLPVRRQGLELACIGIIKLLILRENYMLHTFYSTEISCFLQKRRQNFYIVLIYNAGMNKSITKNNKKGKISSFSMREFFRKHIILAIIAAVAAEYFLNELIGTIIELCFGEFGTSNAAYFVRKIILKVIPSFIIAFCLGTLDSFKNPVKYLGKSLLSGLVILFISVFGSVILTIDSITKGAELKAPGEILFFAAFVLMVGLSEELLMRGTITGLLTEKFGKEGKGMVLSVVTGACIFGLYHLWNLRWTHDLKATLLQVLGTAMIGMLLCAVYVKWGNLLGVIILHAALDFMTLSEYGLFAGKSIADRSGEGGGELSQTIISNSIFVIAAIIVMLHKKKETKENERNGNESKSKS